VFYGVNTSFTYKNFDFGMNWEARGNYNLMWILIEVLFQNILLRETDLQMVLPIFLKQGLEVKTRTIWIWLLYPRRVIYSFDNVSVGYTLTKKNSNSTMKLILQLRMS
jgi:iron complex outermembrane receptor protein